MTIILWSLQVRWHKQGTMSIRRVAGGESMQPYLIVSFGAGGEGRTLTPLRAPDFEH